MRLGEIKNILDQVLDTNHQIIIASEPLFEGHAYRVTNFSLIAEALTVLKGQAWNDLDSSKVETVRAKYGSAGAADMEAEEFRILSDYITALNARMPIYYSILTSVVAPQDPQVINLKLPTNVKTLNELSELNNRLDVMFKAFQVDSPFDFQEFDCGTNWYVVKAVGIATYTYFIACLKAAKDFLDAKTAYYNSKKAQLDYEAGLNDKEEPSKDGLANYTEKRLKLMVSEAVKEAVEEIGKINAHSTDQLHSKLVIATTKLIKELENGTEFHLSLNPPSYAGESGGRLTINYKKIPKQEVEAKELPPTIKENEEPKKDVTQ